jgi:hypothetical protein
LICLALAPTLGFRQSDTASSMMACLPKLKSKSMADHLFEFWAALFYGSPPTSANVKQQTNDRVLKAELT